MIKVCDQCGQVDDPSEHTCAINRTVDLGRLDETKRNCLEGRHEAAEHGNNLSLIHATLPGGDEVCVLASRSAAALLAKIIVVVVEGSTVSICKHCKTFYEVP